jgi:hypothetical protein
MHRDRAWRLAQRRRVIANRLRLLRNLGSPLLARFHQRPNQLGARHPLDCGKTRCGVCHPSKRNPRERSRAANLEILRRREAIRLAASLPFARPPHA